MPPDTNTTEMADLPEHFDISVAALTEDSQQLVVDGMADGLSASDALSLAQDADAHRENIEQDRHDQAVAADHGDYAKADEFAQKSEYEMKDVVADGGNMDVQIHSTEHDQMELSYANMNQETAQENADTSHAYLATGDVDHAAQYGDVAVAHAETAADQGHAGDAGGVYADHDASQATETTEA